MKQDYSAILHHKYSLEDGHVTAQITSIDGYKGVMMTNNEDENRDQSPFSSVLSLEAIQQDPKLLKENNIVGVHIHHGSLAPKFQFLKEQYGLPMFVGFRGKDATAFPKKKENLKLLKKLFQTGDLFFPVCEHLKQEIIKLGCPKHKIRVLYGGVDLERFECRPRKIDIEKKIRFLAIGRFVEKKGFQDLIRAFAEVKERHLNVKLILVGNGPCELEYRKLIKSLFLTGSVQIIPWVDYQKIQTKYYRSHIFCAPSRTDLEGNQEGIPNTLKEAMATGMPIVSTTHAGIPELVKNKVSGLLVPEGSVIELAQAMIWLVEHPEYWEKFGKNARKKVETHFNMKLQLKKQKKFYDEIILKK
ncbi:colanic acid biosynthesis glycosyltransferase WcaL [Paenibacillus psychroresistens]|uniref:Colanic acid biosynthesis glycosyltransferase WcaL n=1 Tax=Paenibacillus psychroresistens TaxID=1778678 RepID=A0A6B8RH95_9BACL|nr:glycosyltransferase [Paenibacillus psychroresistens]QGQ94922.1 colanic acid biosynthesis glycosyltransferase WcaL [Paenibacillus psychroresistens]